MANAAQHYKVHLVGSVPLESAEQVFLTTSSILGDHVERLPDGETGIRSNWIGWQAGVLANNPYFELIPPDPGQYAALPRFRLRSPLPSGEVKFGPLGYADAAISSYNTFSELKQAGTISKEIRFQVCLPTPIATVAAFITPEDWSIAEPAYEARMLEEVQEIAAAIPHSELAIQWDTAVEFGILEGVWPPVPGDMMSALVQRLIRIGMAVPADIEMGYHLCYGDAGHQHFKQPEDTSKLVEVANRVSEGVTRPINWIHMPVPRNRTDDAYFAPLRNLKLHPETQLYLGVVHFTDGVEGTQKRIEAAQRTITDFGIGTECGLGRRPPETIPDLLRIHTEV